MNETIHTITIAEAAKILKTTPLNILMHIKRRHLEGREKDGVWMIDCASLDALLEKTGGKAEGVCASGCTKKHACGGGCS